MSDKNTVSEVGTPKKDQASGPNEGDRGQAIQINENTVDDPNPPEADPGDDHLHSRTDVPKRDQALQINENTIADKE